MQRYFLPFEKTDEQLIKLPKETAHHLRTVLRAEVGTPAEFVFKDHQAYLGRVAKVDDGTWVTLESKLDENRSLPIRITIACGLPKGEKTQLITQKATELGVDRIIFFQSERSISKWNTEKQGKKVERLQTIAQNASEQSHRTDVPIIEYMPKLEQVLALPYDQKLVAWEEAAKQGEQSKLVQVFNHLTEGQTLLAIFGPEGGLSEQEVSLMNQAGVETAGLGPRILRTETAPLYLLAAASFHFELE